MKNLCLVGLFIISFLSHPVIADTNSTQNTCCECAADAGSENLYFFIETLGFVTVIGFATGVVFPRIVYGSCTLD
jgi:hypothetical protein